MLDRPASLRYRCLSWLLPAGVLLFVNCAAAEEKEKTAGARQSVVVDDLEAAHRALVDRLHSRLYRSVWRSAMGIDHMFGSAAGEEAYQETSGSIAPALLWDEFQGFKPRLRFRANIPLPQINERFSAFIGRVNPDEYVTERDPESGAFRRQYGPLEEDQTLFGVSYRQPPRLGGRFDAGTGVRVRFPLDPYVKGSYIYALGSLQRALFTFRETAFWQNSEQLGVTSRIDIERVVGERWMYRWTGSGTLSQESQGVRGYSAFTVLRGLSERRAVAFEVGLNGESKAEVPLREYGIKAAYRRAIARDWLILELRSSLTWPKEFNDQPRAPSWGVGVGLEIMFGSDNFLARPTTF